MSGNTKFFPYLTAAAVAFIALLAFLIFGLREPGENAQLPNFIFGGQQEQGGLLDTNEAETSLSAESEVPFADLTIPYLRQKQYLSQLGELRQLSRNSQYVSYLTSYQSDGLRINGLLTQPVGEPPAGGWPAIVFVHGYIAPSVYRTEERYLDHVAQLARNGFVVFKIDLRGHDESEGEAGGAYYSGDYISDVLHAYSALENAEFINSKKIGLWGHSMAGNVVLRSMAAKPDIPAAVIWAGAVYSYEDFQKYGLDDNSYRPPAQTSERQRRRQALFDTHGEFNSTSQFWQQVAATNYLSDLEGTIQLHHAADDTVVSINYSRDLVPKLETAQIEHEFYEYPQGGHNISGSSFTTAMQRTITFFKSQL